MFVKATPLCFGWPYAAGSRGGYPTNSDNEKLFRGCRQVATNFLKILPDNWDKNMVQEDFACNYKFMKVVNQFSGEHHLVVWGEGTFGTVYKAKASYQCSFKNVTRCSAGWTEGNSNLVAALWISLHCKIIGLFLFRIGVTATHVLCTITPFGHQRF